MSRPIGIRQPQSMIDAQLAITGTEEISHQTIRGVPYVLERRTYSHGGKQDDYAIRDDVGPIASFQRLEPAITYFASLDRKAA